MATEITVLASSIYITVSSCHALYIPILGVIVLSSLYSDKEHTTLVLISVNRAAILISPTAHASKIFVLPVVKFFRKAASVAEEGLRRPAMGASNYVTYYSVRCNPRHYFIFSMLWK
jgi:hypothetical protein